MITQPEIEVAILQVCNQLGMNAVLPSENMVIQAWKELAYDKQAKNSIAGLAWREKSVRQQVINGVREFYKEKRKKEQDKL
jgi:hypothetical protein